MRQLTELLRGKSEILFALIHGSFLEDQQFRDVDIALFIDPGLIGSAAFREYESDMAIRLSDCANLPIDVRLLNDAPVAFRYHALKGKVLVVREPELFDDFRARTWDEYFDFAPFARGYLREVIGG